MRETFSISFSYLNETFSAIVRVKKRKELTEYDVRIMNASLNYWLYNNHIFRSVNDQMIEDQDTQETKERILYLKSLIRNTLQSWLSNKNSSSFSKEGPRSTFQQGL